MEYHLSLMGIRPISANMMYVTTPKVSAKYRKFREDIKMLLAPQNIPKLDGPVLLTIIYKLKGKRLKMDLDNMIKTLIDSISPFIFTVGDQQVYKLITEKIMNCQTNSIEITYEPYISAESMKDSDDELSIIFTPQTGKPLTKI